MKYQTLSPKLFLSLGAIFLLAANGACFAKNTKEKTSRIYIDNENNKKMDVLINPSLVEDRSVDEEKRLIDPRKGSWITLELPANSVIEYDLHQSDIGKDVDTFSVSGETNPITPIGKCANLKIGEDYLLRFTDNAFGTDCYSQEIKGNLPSFSKQKIQVKSKKSGFHKATDVEYAPNRASQATNKE